MVGQPKSDGITSTEPKPSDDDGVREARKDGAEEPTDSKQMEVNGSERQANASREDHDDEKNAVSSPAENSDSPKKTEAASEAEGGDKKGPADKPPLPPSTSIPTEKGRPPLPNRPPPHSNRRHRSHSMDNSELSGLGIDKNGADDEFIDPFDVLPSAASTGILEESEHLDRLLGDDEPAYSNLSPDVFDAFSDPNFDEDTPVAAALRANAEVRVSNVSKFARRMKAQNIRRFVKRAAFVGKSGHVRGKPPRAPPFRGTENDIIGGSMPNIYAVKEESGEVDFMDSSIDSDKVSPTATGNAALKGKDLPNSAPPTMQNQRAASQPTLPTDAWRHRSQKDYVDMDDPLADFGTQGIPEKDKTPAAKHSGPADGIPTEVHTSPEGTGRGKLQLGHPRKNWKRRKAKKKKTERKSYVKGKVIDGEHELYTLSIAVMLGLRTSIGMTNKQMGDSDSPKYLESDDFKQTEKYVFRPKGGPRTPPHQLSHTFKFKDYSPRVFAYLRRMFGINEFEFLLSVCGNANFIEFISNAKSGQFFFYSYDGKYMIKTMTNAESKFLRRILPDYFRHCAKNPNTLVTKFLGMYRVKLYHLRRNVKFVIMNSVFDTDKVIKSLYDLKGSTTGRDAKPHHDVKKDNDFRRGRPDSVMVMKPEVRTRVREQVVRDCEFFKKMKIMDYSMLVGIHYIPPKQKSTGESSHRLGESGRLSFRDSLRDMSSRKKSSHRFGQSEDQKGISQVGGEHTKSDKVLHTPIKDQEKHGRGASVGLSKPPTPGRKTSVGTLQSTASVGSDVGVLGDGTVASLQTLEYVFEDDDDNSYLDCSNLHPSAKSGHDPSMMASNTAPANYHVSKETTTQAVLPGHLPFNLPLPVGHEEGSVSTKPEDIEVKKELTTQQMFWPFHRFYDIHGRRRMIPMRCPQCEELDCSCGGDKEVFKKWNVAPFEPPLSNRKDRGFMMDMSGVKTPMKVNLPSGGTLKCDGKIFYFGIIDILQQFSVRKRAEAILRRYQGSGWQEASCVHPDLYADRFVSFFDECTIRDPVPTDGNGERSTPSDGDGLKDDGSQDVEEIVFHSAETQTIEEGKSEILPPPSDVDTPKAKTKGFKTEA